jgi:hypothetical protein
MMTFGNYDRSKGARENEGITRQTLCSEVVRKFGAVGITWRKPADVRTKITEMERKYKDADKWRNATGSGIMADKGADGVDEVKSYIMKYYELHSSMKDQPTNRPPITTSDPLDDSLDDDSYDESDDSDISRNNQGLTNNTVQLASLT